MTSFFLLPLNNKVRLQRVHESVKRLAVRLGRPQELCVVGSGCELVALQPSKVLDLSSAVHELADELSLVLAKGNVSVGKGMVWPIKVVKASFKLCALCASRSKIFRLWRALSRSLCLANRSARSWLPNRPKSIIAKRIRR